jgi:vitamin B12 transporter
MQRMLFPLYALAIVLYLSSPASAQPEEAEDEMKVLRMFYKENDLVETASRYPKPISQVAENITIVTAEEIEAINAHTLSDVLNYIPGVQLEITGGPGSVTNPHIQGSDFRHVLVMIDGVALNNLSDNIADIGSIPVQQIERVEIIKGPASSSWGSSLGGVINVITKTADDSRRFGGIASASIGERNTGDYRGEASGRTGPLGYYLYAGKLLSDGLTPGTSFDGNNFYTKLHWSADEKSGLLLTLGYSYGTRGAGEFPDPAFDLSFRNDFERFFATLALNHPLSDNLEMNISVRGLFQNSDIFQNQLSTGATLAQLNFGEATIGGSAKLTWREGMHNLLFGGDYDNGELEADSLLGGKQRLEKWALFANDTITSGGFSFTPGVRYDRTNTNGHFFSPSFGATYSLAGSTILRASVARGFNIPPLFATFGTGIFSLPNPDLKVERVWSYQAGLESAALKYIWLKTTLFRHDISDVIVTRPSGDFFVTVNGGEQRRQGVELELKSLPVYNASLLAGFSYIEAKNLDSGERIANVGRSSYDIGLRYDDRQSFSGDVKGHYILWNDAAAHNAFVWDLYLAKKLFTRDDKSAEAFFSCHNLFNATQFLDPLFRSPGRWFEGGVRFRF